MPITCPISFKPLSTEDFGKLDYSVMASAFATHKELGRLADEEISAGDVVLTGGELPALMIIDAVARLVPGVLGNAASAQTDSFATGLLDFPSYTRPADYRGLSVPPVLLSGDHGAIERWRHDSARAATRDKRPDLIELSSTVTASTRRPRGTS